MAIQYIFTFLFKVVIFITSLWLLYKTNEKEFKKLQDKNIYYNDNKE